MRRQRRGRQTAALCALAVFVCMLAGAVWLFRQHRPPLVIEVMAPEAALPAAVPALPGQPRVLIYHTHTWEAYEMTEETQYEETETWRTKDERYNMIRVGAALAQELETRGFFVVHDRTAFEPPRLSGAYTRSLEMINARLNAGEHYDYIIDVHRDAYSGPYNGGNSVRADGIQAAYVMLLVGKGTGATGAGFDERPDWPRNLELAQAVTDEMAALTPGIAREVKIKTGRFNQHVSPGAMLIEVGNNRNTLDEALAACPVIAGALAAVHAGRQAQ